MFYHTGNSAASPEAEPKVFLSFKSRDQAAFFVSNELKQR